MDPRPRRETRGRGRDNRPDTACTARAFTRAAGPSPGPRLVSSSPPARSTDPTPAGTADASLAITSYLRPRFEHAVNSVHRKRQRQVARRRPEGTPNARWTSRTPSLPPTGPEGLRAALRKRLRRRPLRALRTRAHLTPAGRPGLVSFSTFKGFAFRLGKATSRCPQRKRPLADAATVPSRRSDPSRPTAPPERDTPWHHSPTPSR